MNKNYTGIQRKSSLILAYDLWPFYSFIQLQYIQDQSIQFWTLITNWSEAEFKEFEPRLKSTKTRFKLRAGINLETFYTILIGTNNIYAAA